jgi:hypothetical protein
MAQYLTTEESLRDFESQIDPQEKGVYEGFRHKRIEAGFVGRIYVIYKPTGLTKEGKHRPPDVLGQVKVTHFEGDAFRGFYAVVEDMETGEEVEIDHIPRAILDYDVFMSIPPTQHIRFDGRRVGDKIKRSLVFGVLIKTRTRSDHYSAGVTMIETPKGIAHLYDGFDLNLQLN